MRNMSRATIAERRGKSYYMLYIEYSAKLEDSWGTHILVGMSGPYQLENIILQQFRHKLDDK